MFNAIKPLCFRAPDGLLECITGVCYSTVLPIRGLPVTYQIQ